MTDMPKGQALLGQRALVLGIANEHSIAYGCAKVFRDPRGGTGHHLPEREGEALRGAPRPRSRGGHRCPV